MALFKPLRGTRASLPQELHDGYAYFCTDDGSFHIDYIDADGNLQRKQINANDAATLCGMSFEQIQTSISWNDLLNKPVDVIKSGTLTWNGDMASQEVVYGSMYFKISDATPAVSELNNGYSMTLSLGDIYSTDQNNCVMQDEGNGAVTLSGDTGIPFAVIVYETNTDVPSGTYFLNTNAVIDGGYYLASLTINGYNGFTKETIRESYIPDTIARVSDIPEQVQSDWNVNDEANPAYVQNRTHWVSVDHKAWFDNETITFEYSNNVYNKQIALDEPILSVDHIYTVVIDNESYECVAYEFEGMACLGNLSILDSSLTNTNELFFMYSPLRDGVGGADGSFITIATSLDGDSHVVTLSADVTTYHKIDENYLPTIIGRTGERVGSEIFNDYENNFAGGAYAHAEGFSTWASGYASHAEGESTKATFENAHAEGYQTTASGSNSHAEGNKTTASNYNAHAEGNNTVASGHSSHAEGVRTEASGQGSHAAGQDTKASAYNAHAEGQGTEAAAKSQHVFGEYNIVDKSSGAATRGKYIQIAGNGGSANAKSNAYTLDWSGNAWFAGDVKVGGTGQDDADAKILATTEYVDSKAVQSDWSIHDEADPAYIKNRTHWAKISQTEILSESPLEVTADGYFTITNKIEAVTDRTYIINWNGTPYTCVARLLNGQVCLGNGGNFGETDTGEPFLIGFYPAYIATDAGFYAIIIPFDGSTTCTISIVEQVEDIQKLDDKYLSDEVLAKYDWDAAEGELGHILNRTHYIEEALEEVIPETTVTFGDVTKPGYDTGTATGSAIQIYPERGEMFAIEWNGVKYYSEVRSYTKLGGSFGRGIGNTGMFGGAVYAEYPFLIGFLTEEEAATAGYTYFVWVNDESTTATFSVSKVGELVHKLDAKYLPENIATQEYVRSFLPKSTTVTIPAANWTGTTNPWSQVVTINGVTANSKVDLQPTATQIVALQNKEITLMLQNDSGVITAWAIGDKPTEDYTMQVLITEVTLV